MSAQPIDQQTPSDPQGSPESLGATLVARRPDLSARLSTAQIRVLELLLVGLTEPQIAQRVGRSRHTIHDHTKAIYGVLGVSNRIQLLLLFQEARPALRLANESPAVPQ